MLYARDENGKTFLHWAAQFDFEAVVTCLVCLNLPAKIETSLLSMKDKRGRTPLYYAFDNKIDDGDVYPVLWEFLLAEKEINSGM